MKLFGARLIVGLVFTILGPVVGATIYLPISPPTDWDLVMGVGLIVGLAPALAAGGLFIELAETAPDWLKLHPRLRATVLGATSGLGAASLFLVLLWMAQGASLSPHVGWFIIAGGVVVPSAIAGAVCGLLVAGLLSSLAPKTGA